MKKLLTIGTLLIMLISPISTLFAEDYVDQANRANREAFQNGVAMGKVAGMIVNILTQQSSQTDRNTEEQANQAKQSAEDIQNEYIQKGNEAFNNGDYEHAIRFYRDAIIFRTNDTNPILAEVYNNRGVAYYYKGDMMMALADYKKACGLGLEVACNNYNAAK